MSAVSEVPLKFVVLRNGEIVEVRVRRLVNPSYEVLEKVTSEIAKGAYKLQYTDEDGDVVTMSSQEEWAECLASWDRKGRLKVMVALSGKGRACSRSRSSSASSCERRARCHSWTSRRCMSPGAWKHHGWFPFAQANFDVGHATKLSMPAESSSAANEPAKCGNCAFQTGVVSGYCCKKCMRGRGHGKRCEQKLFEAAREENTVDVGGDAEKCDAQQTGCRREQRRQEAAVGASSEKRCGKGWKGRHGHCGKGWKGMFGAWLRGNKEEVNQELVGQKCANCDCRTTGIVDLFCCRACMWGGGHGHRCQQLPFVAEDAGNVTMSNGDDVVTRVLAKMFGSDVVEAVKGGDVPEDVLCCQHWLTVEKQANGDVDLKVKVDALAATLQSMAEAAERVGDGALRDEWMSLLAELRGGAAASAAQQAPAACSSSDVREDVLEAAQPSQPVAACDPPAAEHAAAPPAPPAAAVEVIAAQRDEAAAASTAATAPSAVEQYRTQILQLEEMGFAVGTRMLDELVKSHGNVADVLAALL